MKSKTILLKNEPGPFRTRMSAKGQVVIVKELREQLNLKPKQKFIERAKDGKIILEPIPSIFELGGMLKGMEKRPISEVMKEIKEGWE